VAVARQQVGQNAAGLGRLPASEIVERNVACALQPSSAFHDVSPWRM